MPKYEITSAEKKLLLDAVSPEKIVIDSQSYHIDSYSRENSLTLIQVNGKSFEMYCKKLSDTSYEIYSGHHIIPIEIEDHRKKILDQFQQQTTSQSGLTIVKAPMPGLVTTIEVKVGDQVEPGTGLLVLEAMKMENEINSSVRGKIKSIEVKEKMAIEKNQVLISIEAIS